MSLKQLEKYLKIKKWQIDDDNNDINNNTKVNNDDTCSNHLILLLILILILIKIIIINENKNIKNLFFEDANKTLNEMPKEIRELACYSQSSVEKIVFW